MRESAERDLAVAGELGRMADARIRELESERREFQTLIRMCLQQFEFQYGKRQRGWDAQFLMDRCEALLGIQPQDAAIDSSSAFADYLPLSPVRVAPGEYAIKDRSGRTLWTIDGAALADWVCQSVNGYDGAVAAMAKVNPAIDESLLRWLTEFRQRRQKVSDDAVKNLGSPDKDTPKWMDVDHLLGIIDAAMPSLNSLPSESH